MKITKLFLAFVLLSSMVFAQKREFRSSWLTSVSNLDWPSSNSLSPGQQKFELISILEELKDLNINAVFLQVRTESDALYNSSFEPWSYWLTGSQGTAPSPSYDPLQFAIEEAHKRGIELHAWLNQYRAEGNIGHHPLHSSHVTNQHPEWILTFGAVNFKMLDPGLGSVRNYIQSVVMDIVNNYDVDGIIFDDFFYPYPNSSASFFGITSEDDDTFANESRGFTNKADWRRDNVNLLMSSLNIAIKGVKPYVKFGISPFGIWKNGVPSGITGLNAYTDIYCDATAWLTAQSIDYLSPQIYWPFGGSQDYGTLLPWWGTKRNGRHIYSSMALYRSSSWASDEITNQIDLNRSNADCEGSVYFRHSYLGLNPHNIYNTLKTSYYQNKALAPQMSWLGGAVPNAPTNFIVSSIYAGNTLSWQNSSSSNLKYNVIYRSETTPIDLTDENNILEILSATENSYMDKLNPNSTSYYYCITTTNKYDLESSPTNEVISDISISTVVIDDFEVSDGHFDKHLRFSGSTTGISNGSYKIRSSEETFFESNASLRIILKDDASSSGDWRVRLLSGTGSPANNMSISSTKYVGYWLKTNSASAGAKVGFLIDDSDGIEKSLMKDVINDNEWHFYEWNLSDDLDWNAFIASANGVIDASQVTIDALYFTAPNASPDWTFFIDDVLYQGDEMLPVELTKFDATFANNSVQLNWETSTEINNFGFSIERKSDNEEWNEITFIEGQGNSNATNYYSYNDNVFGKTEKYYYRIKQIDIDGNFEYSKTLMVELKGLPTTELFANYPNPFNPTTTISFRLAETSQVTISVYNTVGEKVEELVNDELESGIHKVNFDGSNLASGFYIYRIVTPNYSKTMKMMLLK